jgi:glycoside/pentoside/hexuronide:cation symporter, GPH family
MYADTADYSEWKNGRRATGLVFSAASMSQKFGASIGMYMVGLLLTLIWLSGRNRPNVAHANGNKVNVELISCDRFFTGCLFYVYLPV